jgi:quercetin dioxygenase-like cupin family protein
MQSQAAQKSTVDIVRANRGRRIRLLGNVLEWKLTPAETGNQFCVLEALIPAGSFVPAHQHAPHESFMILEGQLEFARLVNGALEWFTANTGDFVTIPGNEIHGFRNSTAQPARMLNISAAAIGAFFEEVGVPVDADFVPSGRPSKEDIDRVIAAAEKHNQPFWKP